MYVHTYIYIYIYIYILYIIVSVYYYYVATWCLSDSLIVMPLFVMFLNICDLNPTYHSLTIYLS